MAAIKLKVSNLVRHFGEVKAVDGISFELKEGEVVGFIGANGAGKTTTMRVLTTLDVPDEGTIEIDGMDAQQHPENYEHLMVRVGGYSARFVTLDAKLQASIIERIRHCC